MPENGHAALYKLHAAARLPPLSLILLCGLDVWYLYIHTHTPCVHNYMSVNSIYVAYQTAVPCMQVSFTSSLQLQSLVVCSYGKWSETGARKAWKQSYMISPYLSQLYLLQILSQHTFWSHYDFVWWSATCTRCTKNKLYIFWHALWWFYRVFRCSGVSSGMTCTTW